MLLLGLWTFLLSNCAGFCKCPRHECWQATVPAPIHIKRLNPVFWLQHSCDSFLRIRGRAWKAATAKNTSMSHRYLKRFSAFHLLSLLRASSSLSFMVNILPGQWENPKFSFFFLCFFFCEFFSSSTLLNND